MVVCVEDDEDVLDEADECERPEDEAEDAEQIVLVWVRQGERREGVERRRPDVAIHHSQRLVPQQRHLPRRELLHAVRRRRRRTARSVSSCQSAMIGNEMEYEGIKTYHGVAVPQLVRLAEGAAGEAGAGELAVAGDDLLLDLARRAPLVDGGHRGRAHLDDDVVRPPTVLHGVGGGGRGLLIDERSRRERGGGQGMWLWVGLSLYILPPLR